MGARADVTYPAGRTFTDRDGVLHPAGVTSNVVISAVSFALTADQSGSVVLITAADKVVTLPAAAAGLVFTVMLGTGGLSSGTGLTVTPGAGDLVTGNGFTPSATKGPVNSGATDVVGDAVTLVGTAVNSWYITNVTGTWARTA